MTQVLFVGPGAASSTFQQTGSSENRSVASRLRDTTHIFDFIPAGQHAAIQARTSAYDAHADFVTAMNSVTYENSATSQYKVGPTIRLPHGRIELSDSLILKKQINFIGPEGGELSDHHGSILSFAQDKHGIIVHRFDGFGVDGWSSPWASGVVVTVGSHRNVTSSGGLSIYECTVQGGGNTADRPIHSSGAVTGADGYEWTWVAPATGADGSMFRSICLFGSTSGTIGHGIWARARFVAENLYIQDFRQDGYYIAAEVGATDSERGNANNFRIMNGRVVQCRNGYYVQGADANAGVIIGLDTSANRGWGRWDHSFLGNWYYGCHTNGNGIAAKCSHGGNRYMLYDVAGADIEPGTVGADSYWWFAGVGGVSSSWPAWATPNTFIEGGGYKSDGSNSQSICFAEYTEGGQPVHLGGRSTSISGTASIFDLTVESEGTIASASNDGFLFNTLGFRRILAGSSNTCILKILPTTGDGHLLSIDHDTWTTNVLRLAIESDGRLRLQHTGSGFSAFSTLTDNSTVTFGRSAVPKGAMFIDQLFVGGAGVDVGTASLGRQVFNGTAAPTSASYEFNVGDLCLNRAPARGEPAGWICITAGSPGTWAPLATLTGVATVATNADFTLTPLTSKPIQLHTGTLTADRAVTLSTTNAWEGMSFKITRTGPGAFNLNVGTGPLKALVQNTWGEFVYDGAAWYLAAYGAL